MSEDHVLARVGLRAQIASRRAAARRLLEAAEGADPGGQQVALLGLGEMGIADAVPYLRMRLGDEDATIRASAAWSLVRLARDAAACRSLQDAVESAEPCGGLAADWIARCLAPPEACRWIDQLASREPLVPRAIQAAAALGDPARLDWLVACMSSTPLARQAGEAFGQITGLDLAQAGFESPPPPGFDTLPNEDPTDDRVALDPWERYPWPDVPRVASWLADHRSAWQEGERYFLGQRLEREVLARTLRWGTQFQRGAAARELAVQDPGVPYFNVASHAHVQRQRLSLPRHHRAS